MKNIKWQPQHFPVGTVVVLGDYKIIDNEFVSCENGNAEVTVTQCVYNGNNDWLIKTDSWNVGLKCFRVFNFNYIKCIKTRGDGPVKFETKTLSKRINFKKEITNDILNKNDYCCISFSIREFLNLLIKDIGFPIEIEIKREFEKFFLTQTFVKTTKLHKYISYYSFNKKKTKKFLRQNINRWIKPMKQILAEKEESDKQDYEDYIQYREDDFDAKLDEQNKDKLEKYLEDEMLYNDDGTFNVKLIN